MPKISDLLIESFMKYSNFEFFKSLLALEKDPIPGIKIISNTLELVSV